MTIRAAYLLVTCIGDMQRSSHSELRGGWFAMIRFLIAEWWALKAGTASGHQHLFQIKRKKQMKILPFECGFVITKIGGIYLTKQQSGFCWTTNILDAHICGSKNEANAIINQLSREQLNALAEQSQNWSELSTNSALNTQIGGSHYKDCAIQPVEFSVANDLGFIEGCIVKRITRHNKPTGKGRQDIEKSIHELQLLLELKYPVDEVKT